MHIIDDFITSFSMVFAGHFGKYNGCAAARSVLLAAPVVVGSAPRYQDFPDSLKDYIFDHLSSMSKTPGAFQAVAQLSRHSLNAFMATVGVQAPDDLSAACSFCFTEQLRKLRAKEKVVDSVISQLLTLPPTDLGVILKNYWEIRKFSEAASAETRSSMERGVGRFERFVARFL